MTDAPSEAHAPINLLQAELAEPAERAGFAASTASTISPKTEALYATWLQSMIRYSERERSDGDETDHPIVTARDIVADFLSRTDLSPATARAYRAALLWHLRALAQAPQEPDRLDATRLLDLLQAVKLTGGARSDSHPPIPEDDYRDLLDELTRRGMRGSAWAVRAQLWLVAGMATGLRPVEWLHADWTDNTQSALRVRTAKAHVAAPAFLREGLAPDQIDQVARTPAYREIPVERVSDRMAIDEHLQNLRAELPDQTPKGENRATDLSREDAYDRYFQNVRNVIYRACQALWGKEKCYSLYSARTQFSANSRASIGFDATSTLLGHSRPDSPSGSHYAGARHAHARFRGRADQDTQSEDEAEAIDGDHNELD